MMVMLIADNATITISARRVASVTRSITTIDNALTRPWTVNRFYQRNRGAKWQETICGEDEHQVKIGGEQYYLSADGVLMPTRKNQPPPDLQYFQTTK